MKSRSFFFAHEIHLLKPYAISLLPHTSAVSHHLPRAFSGKHLKRPPPFRLLRLLRRPSPVYSLLPTSVQPLFHATGLLPRKGAPAALFLSNSDDSGDRQRAIVDFCFFSFLVSILALVVVSFLRLEVHRSRYTTLLGCF